jgi:HEAT repeat protein
MSSATIRFALAAALVLGATAPLWAQTVPAATPEQVEKFIAALESSEATHKEKVDACRGLAVIGPKEAVPALAALLADEKLSHMARYALEVIPDPSADEALREALGRAKGLPLAGVAASVGVRRDAKAVPALARLLDDADARVAQAAARSLGRIGTAEASQALLARLPKARGELKLAVADGCLGCAEAMLAAGKRAEAAAVYDAVAKAELPKHVRLAAVQGAMTARQPAP